MKKVDRRSFLKTAACGLAACANLAGTEQVTAKPASVKNRKVKKDDKSWSLVILPDTQYYSEQYPGLFHLQTQWVLENRDKYNIVYVLQNGDVTNNNSKTQWQRASRALARLDGKVPYAISFGNHDYGPGGSSRDRNTLGNEFFGVSRFEKWPTFGRPMEAGKMDNTCHTFNAARQDYLILCLEFGPRDEVLQWANRIIEKHSTHKVITMTHAYLYSDSTRYNWQQKSSQQKWNPHSYPFAQSDTTTVNDGQQIWDKLVRKHSNCFMTVNGHVCNDGLGFLTSRADHGNDVHQMLVNFQMLAEGGGAWLRILNFQPHNKTISVKDYSPLYEEFNTSADNQFTINL